MKAWIIKDDYEGKATIVFCGHGLQARRIGANELNIDFEDAESTRAKELDQYSGMGFVPPDILVKEHGWWHECHYCMHQVDDNNKDVDQCFSAGDRLFCSQRCKDDYDNEVSLRNKEYEDFQTAILSLFPKYNITGFSGGWPSKSPTAYFSFPGQKHQDGSLRIVDNILQQFVCTGDLESFNSWSKAQSDLLF